MKFAREDASRLLPPLFLKKEEVAELKALNKALLQKLAELEAENQRLKLTESIDFDSSVLEERLEKEHVKQMVRAGESQATS